MAGLQIDVTLLQKRFRVLMIEIILNYIKKLLKFNTLLWINLNKQF